MILFYILGSAIFWSILQKVCDCAKERLVCLCTIQLRLSIYSSTPSTQANVVKSSSNCSASGVSRQSKMCWLGWRLLPNSWRQIMVKPSALLNFGIPMCLLWLAWWFSWTGTCLALFSHRLHADHAFSPSVLVSPPRVLQQPGAMLGCCQGLRLR